MPVMQILADVSMQQDVPPPADPPAAAAAQPGLNVVHTSVQQQSGPAMVVLLMSKDEPPAAVVEMAQQAARQLGAPSVSSNSAPAVNEVMTTAEFIAKSGHLLAPQQLAPVDPANSRRSGSDHVLRPAGLVLFADMAQSMAPLGAFRWVTVQGVAEGKLFAAEVTNLAPNVFGHSMNHECRMPFVTNVYLTKACADYGARRAMSFQGLDGDHHAARAQRRDYCIGLAEDQLDLRYLLGGLARVGVHVHILGSVARVESFSLGRCETWILPVQQNIPLCPNGPVQGFAAGAAGLVSYLYNQCPEVAVNGFRGLADLSMNVLMTIDQFRLKLLSFKACLTDHESSDTVLKDLAEAQALYNGHPLTNTDDALAYRQNVLEAVSNDNFRSWKAVPKRILTDQVLFTKLTVMACPMLSGYFDVDRHVSKDFGHLPAGATIPFVALTKDGRRDETTLLPVTREDLLFQVVTFWVSMMSHELTSVGLQAEAVLQFLAIMVPGFDNLVQAVLITAIRASGRAGHAFGRPGCPIDMVLAKLQDSSDHLFLTKNDLDSWDLDRVRKYAFPHHLLPVSQMNSLTNIQLGPIVDGVTRGMTTSGARVLFRTTMTFEQACKQGGLLTDQMVEELYGLTNTLDVVDDQHVEAVQLPVAVTASPNVELATFLARKCLAMTLQKWNVQSGGWSLDLTRYE